MAPPGAGQITPAAGNVAFKVTAQTPTLGIGPDGKAVEGYRVSFETGSGAQGWVFLPYNLYSAANVQAAISPHARELDQVQGLKAGM
jgi:hypothetical protein